MEALDRFAATEAMTELDSIYRCQANEAPMMDQANHWADRYNAAQTRTLTVSPTDLLTLDPFKDPETIAIIQAQALQGAPASLANFTQRVQVDPLASDNAHRLWASRADNSDKALELFADLEYTLATNPAERDLAVELFRRVYLHNGVTTALDLSISLVEDLGRDPAVIAEITDYLTRAGNRGEGASIRLLARLTADQQDELSVYRTFAQVIEERGDFLALMFAIPYVDAARAEDYLDRAVSLMTCGTKDVNEIADAYTRLGQPDLTHHWMAVGLAIEHGNVLAKLAISDRQMDMVGTGPAPSALDVAERARAEGEPLASLTLFDLTADPDLPAMTPRPRRATSPTSCASQVSRRRPSPPGAVRDPRSAPLSPASSTCAPSSLRPPAMATSPQAATTAFSCVTTPTALPTCKRPSAGSKKPPRPATSLPCPPGARRWLSALAPHRTAPPP